MTNKPAEPGPVTHETHVQRWTEQIERNHFRRVEWPADPQEQRMAGLEYASTHVSRSFKTCTLRELLLTADQIAAYINDGVIPPDDAKEK